MSSSSPQVVAVWSRARKPDDIAIQLQNDEWYVQEPPYNSTKSNKPWAMSKVTYYHADEWFYERFHDVGNTIIRGKWVMDGAETLKGAASLLRANADHVSGRE